MKKLLPMSSATLYLMVCVLGLGGGGAAWIEGRHPLANALWAATASLVLVPITTTLVRSLLRRSPGVDVIAILAIVGALILGEYLASAVIGLMLATGRALEEYAARRAERELSSLLQRAPRAAHRLRNGAVETVPVDDVVVSDTLMVKEGDVLPVDGIVSTGPASLDEAARRGWWSGRWGIRCGAGRRTRGRPSACEPRQALRTARMLGSSAWCARPGPRRRRLFAWPTGTRGSSFP